MAKITKKSSRRKMQDPLANHRLIIREKVERVQQESGCDKSSGFTLFCCSDLVLALDVTLNDESDVDGGNDVGIDIMHIDEGSTRGAVIVTVLQAKNSQSLSLQALNRLENGLEALLELPVQDVNAMANPKFSERVEEYRKLRTINDFTEIRINCYVIALHDSSTYSGEVRGKIERIRQRFGRQILCDEFTLDVLGARELHEMIREQRHQAQSIDVTIPIAYESTRPRYMHHDKNDVEAVVCTVSARELAKVVQDHPWIFGPNLRRFRGPRVEVNRSIRETCTSGQLGGLFWYLNNGIVAICKDFKVRISEDDGARLEVKGFEIVNGCQTSTVLAESLADDKLDSSVEVIMRVLKAPDDKIASQVVVTTNKQNQITSRDIHANDPEQVILQEAFQSKLGVYYERNPGAAKTIDTSVYDRIVTNEAIGQAYLGVALGRPSDARRRKYKVWADDRERIFRQSRDPVELMLPLMMVEAVDEWKRERIPQLQSKSMEHRMVTNGVYHIAFVATAIWRGSPDDWSSEAVRSDYQRFKDAPRSFYDILSESFALFESVVNSGKLGDEGWDALKSKRLDEELRAAVEDHLAQRRVSRKKKAKPRVPARGSNKS